MSPRIEASSGGVAINAFTKKAKQSNVKVSKEEQNMSEVRTTEVAEQSNVANSPVSIADLYTEMEKELVMKARGGKNEGVTERIRTLVGQIFASTGKDKLLLSAVVKIVEQQEGRTKLYNLVRSIGQSKSAHAKYGLLSEDGRTYIIQKDQHV